MSNPSFRHTMKLVPSSQRELFVSEIKKHLTKAIEEAVIEYWEGIEKVVQKHSPTCGGGKCYAVEEILSHISKLKQEAKNK